MPAFCLLPVRARPIFFILPALLLSGCASISHLPYTPATTLKASGSLNMGEFSYLPAADTAEKKLRINEIQIENKPLLRYSTLQIDEPVAEFVRNAVAAELSRAGVSIGDNHVTLEGAVEELIPLNGMFTTGLLRISFVVKERATGAVRYRSTKTADGVLSGFARYEGFGKVINQLILHCTDQLIADPQFVQAIQRP